MIPEPDLTVAIVAAWRDWAKHADKGCPGCSRAVRHVRRTSHFDPRQDDLLFRGLCVDGVGLFWAWYGLCRRLIARRLGRSEP